MSLNSRQSTHIIKPCLRNLRNFNIETQEDFIMDGVEERVHKEMRELIVLSCQFEKYPSDLYCNFHKIFLKFSFQAVDVAINYDGKEIYSTNSKPLTTNPVRLFEMNKALVDKLSYSDLEETLSGCLQTGHLQQVFYEKLLLEFAEIGDSDDRSA